MGNSHHVTRTLLGIEKESGTRLLKRKKKRRKKHRFRDRATTAPAWDQYEPREKRVRAILRVLTGLDHEWKSTRSLDWLKNPDGGRNLEIDCWSPTLQIACEVDGLHHRRRVAHFQSTQEEFLAQQRRDRWKDACCRAQGVRLIRVPPRERLCDSKLVCWLTTEFFK